MRIMVLIGVILLPAIESFAGTGKGPSAAVFSCSPINNTSIVCPPDGGRCKATGGKSSDKDGEYGVKIAGPESAEPVLMANLGNVMLSPINVTEDLSVMRETADNGNVILWTWLKRSRRLFQVKAYNLLGQDFSVTILYQCRGR